MNTITWVCDECKQPIEDSDGTVYMPDGAVIVYREKKAVWDEVHPPFTGVSLAALAHVPHPARWAVVHFACDENAAEGGYGLGVHQLRTPQDVLHWTRHLMGKEWFADTRWERVIATALESVPPTAQAY